MSKVAISLHTRDKSEQVKRIIDPLLQPDKYDLFWFDGSDTEAGQSLPSNYPQFKQVRHNVRGSGDNAFVQSLTEILASKENYTHIGIVEDDVLLPENWFEQNMDLFGEGSMSVGAASLRAYEDRILIQRDGYAVLHNSGFGQLIMTREAAFKILRSLRTGWSTENRRVFAYLTGIDIAQFWAFRGKEQWLCEDWQIDTVLAQQGLASLALTPSPVEMLNQNPPLEQQGLRLAKRPVAMRRDDRVFKHYVDRLADLRAEHVQLDARPLFFQVDDGSRIYFSHQLGALGAKWSGEWAMQHNLGFGPFGWKSIENAGLSFMASGPIDVLVGGGKQGGKLLIRDMGSGYEVEPALPAEKQGDQLFTACVVPAGVARRLIKVDKVSPGVIIYGIRTREAQPFDPGWRFDATCLPAASVPEAQSIAAE